MHRSLFFRSIGWHSFRKSKPRESVTNNFVRITQASQSFTTSNGQGCRGGDGDKPVLRSIQAEIVNALFCGERSTASHLLLDLGRGNRVLRAMDFVDILDYCANSPDPLFVMETWRIMVEKKVNMNRRCYLLIIQSLCKGGYLEEAFNLMSSIGENPDIYPSPNMYNFFLKACVQIGSINHASKCLDLMEKQMVGKNVVTYMELLKLAVLQKNLCAVHDIWKECTKYYNLDVVSLRKFIKSFARLGDLNTAHAVLQCTLASTLQGGQAMVETAEGMLTTPNLDIPVPSSELNLEKYSKDNETYIPSLVGHFNDGDIREVQNDRMIWTKDRRMPVMTLLLWLFNDVIHACANIRNPWLAEKLVLQMQKLGLEPTRNTYDGLIRAVIGYRGFQEGLKLLKEMQNKNLRPRDSTFGTISVHCSKVLELDLAESFLDQISSCPYTYPYNYFLQACSILNRPERAIRILAKMRQMKLQLDIRTYELLFSLFGNVNAPYEKGNMLSQLNTAKRISAIEADMRKNGIDHSYLTIRNMLRALGEEGMINDMIHYLRVAENQFSHTNKALGTPIYNTVLDYLVEAREGLLAVEMFKTMITCGYQPDAATYSIMMKCCAVNRDFRSACALLSLMIRDGFDPQVVAYTALIEILLKDKDFNGALNILDQACSEKIQLDVVLFNTMLEAARKKRRLDLVELIVERMHKEKIHPDSSTCRHVFSAYVTGGFFSTAVEALQVLSMRMILADDHTLEGKRGAFEDLILADDLKAESRILELYEDYKEYLVVGLLNLRWCAIMGYPISWLPDQSQWAKRLSNTCASN